MPFACFCLIKLVATQSRAHFARTRRPASSCCTVRGTGDRRSSDVQTHPPVTELYKEQPARRRECLYYLSVGNFKLAQYVEARKYNEILLQMEPRNQQSLTLRELIDSKVRSDGLIGMAIVGGVVASVVAIGLAVFGGKGKK